MKVCEAARAHSLRSFLVVSFFQMLLFVRQQLGRKSLSSFAFLVFIRLSRLVVSSQ